MTHHKLTLGRRDVLKAGGAVAALACAGQGIASTTPFQWERGGPASGRLAPDFAARLAQGVESGEVAIVRANYRVTFRARFMLVAAMNPCRCGKAGDPGFSCRRGANGRCARCATPTASSS